MLEKKSYDRWLCNNTKIRNCIFAWNIMHINDMRNKVIDFPFIFNHNRAHEFLNTLNLRNFSIWWRLEIEHVAVYLQSSQHPWKVHNFQVHGKYVHKWSLLNYRYRDDNMTNDENISFETSLIWFLYNKLQCLRFFIQNWRMPWHNKSWNKDKLEKYVHS